MVNHDPLGGVGWVVVWPVRKSPLVGDNVKFVVYPPPLTCEENISVVVGAVAPCTG